MVSGSMSHHKGGSVGVPRDCWALCGLLCLILWARPERADEVPGTTGTRLDIISSGVQIAVLVINSTLSYMPYRSFYENTTNHGC